jgi:hypothetical protein
VNELCKNRTVTTAPTDEGEGEGKGARSEKRQHEAAMYSIQTAAITAVSLEAVKWHPGSTSSPPRGREICWCLASGAATGSWSSQKGVMCF